MLRSLTILILCQFGGEIMARGLHLPLPGPVVGLVLLLVILLLRRGPDADMQATAGGLLRHLSLLFVPAGVGVVTQLDALQRNWLPIVVSILISTMLALVVTGVTMQVLGRRRAP